MLAVREPQGLPATVVPGRVQQELLLGGGQDPHPPERGRTPSHALQSLCGTALAQQAEHRVAITGVTGSPPPETLKVALNEVSARPT